MYRVNQPRAVDPAFMHTQLFVIPELSVSVHAREPTSVSKRTVKYRETGSVTVQTLTTKLL